MAKINQRIEFKWSFSTRCHIFYVYIHIYIYIYIHTNIYINVKKKKTTPDDAQQKTESILSENALASSVMGKHSSHAKL